MAIYKQTKMRQGKYGKNIRLFNDDKKRSVSVYQMEPVSDEEIKAYADEVEAKLNAQDQPERVDVTERVNYAPAIIFGVVILVAVFIDCLIKR